MELMTGLEPISNESIRSFIIRLAVANDYVMVNHLFGEYQSPKHANMGSCEDTLISLVHSLTSIPDEQVFSPIKVGITKSSNRLGHHVITQRHPVVCADCMTIQNHTDAHWQLYPMTHCLKHEKRLISRCICGEFLVWDEDLLYYGCCHCDAPWQQIAARQEREEVPTYIRHFHQLPETQRGDFIEDLLTACMRALRPYDSVHHGIKQLPHCDVDWADLCCQAFALLCDRDTIEQWCQSIVHVREQYAVMGDHAVFHPLKTMQDRLHQKWLVNGVMPSLMHTSPSIHIFPHHGLTSCNARNNAVLHLDGNDKNQSFIHQIDQRGFAKISGCKLELARNLFKIPSISSLSLVGRGHFSFIDITEFINQTKIQNTEKQCQTSGLADLNEIFERYTLTAEDILIEIYKHHLPIYINKSANTLLEAVCLNEMVLTKHLESTYLNHEPSVILTKTMKILGIPQKRVIQLGTLKLLKELPIKQNHHEYSGESIAQFLAGHICIEHWATLNHCCPSKITHTLSSLGIPPVISPYVFAKTPTLLEALSIEAGEHWQAQEQLALF